MFIVALAVFWSTTFAEGPFADASVSLSDRVLAAQTLVLAAALLALVLAALFAERRRNEAALKQGRERLRLALDGADLGAFSADFVTGRLECDARAAQIHGLNVPPMTLKEARRFVHPDDLLRIDAALAEAERTGGVWNAEYRVVPPPNHPHAGETRWVAVESSIMRDHQGAPVELLGVTRDITERKHAEEQQRMLLAELDHRVKNVLATVSAVATQTMGASGSMEDFVDAFDGRLRSMARTHELLSERRWRGIPLAELLRRELTPYTGANNAQIGGPDVMLSAEAGQAVSMVLHELATNAAKHGAFSTPEGKVSVQWRRQLNGDARAGLVLEWQETGGPYAEAASKAGYGMSVICELIPHELAGKVNYVLTPAGARCQLEIPDRWIDATSPD
jgi:PAS domain S-box-containing protein